MLADHFGHNEHDIHDLVSKRDKYATKGAVLEDMKNIVPIDPKEDIDIFKHIPRQFLESKYGAQEFIDYMNAIAGFDQATVDNSNPDFDPNAPSTADNIIVTAQKTPAPTLSPTLSTYTDPTTLPPPSEKPENEFPDNIVVTATTKPPRPTNSISVPFTTLPPVTETPEPTFTDEIVVTARTTTPPPTKSITAFTLSPSITTFNPSTEPPETHLPTTLPPKSVSLPPEHSLSATDFDPRVYTTAPPRTLSMASTPALTWNPAMFPTYAPGQFPAEYTPLQQFNLPNYANVYDILFQGQGPSSALGQSMLVPPDQQPNRLDVAMAAAQQAQQQAPQQQAPQSNTGTGKARGGSVNDAIDGIIAYLQSIRR